PRGRWTPGRAARCAPPTGSRDAARAAARLLSRPPPPRWSRGPRRAAAAPKRRSRAPRRCRPAPARRRPRASPRAPSPTPACARPPRPGPPASERGRGTGPARVVAASPAAQPAPDAQDPGVATRPFGVPGGDGGEQLVGDLGPHHEARHVAARREVAALPEGDHALRQPPRLLRLRHRGLDALVLEERGDQ